MDSLLKIKKQYIDLLQKYNGWGGSKEEIGDLLDVLGIVDTDLERLKEKPKTNILVDINEIVSPVYLDYNVELPIVELFVDKDNFVVFTTQSIYNCRNTMIEKIGYRDIVGVDENSINDAFSNRIKNMQVVDIKLIITNGNRVPITVEYGISFRPIAYFLTVVNKKG